MRARVSQTDVVPKRLALSDKGGNTPCSPTAPVVTTILQSKSFRVSRASQKLRSGLKLCINTSVMPKNCTGFVFVADPPWLDANKRL